VSDGCRPVEPTLVRMATFRAKATAFSFFVIISLLSRSAVACICDCESAKFRDRGSAVSTVKIPQSEQIFSGWIISTKRVEKKDADAPDRATNTDGYPYYWFRSKILVTRVWRGTPPRVAEVWTPEGSDCDLPMVTGFHVVALVRTENGLSMARHTLCDECGVESAATQGRGTYTSAGVLLIAASLLAGVLFLFTLVKLLGRRRARFDRSEH
jgi:hypothetical protein